MRSSQCASTSRAMRGAQRCSSSRWKPSSHRKPRGKKEREGTEVKSGAGVFSRTLEEGRRTYRGEGGGHIEAWW